MLEPMGWVALYFGLDPNKWNQFYEGIALLDPRDVDELYQTVLMLSQEEWRPVYKVWRLPLLSKPSEVHTIWMNYKVLGIKGRDEQKMLKEVLPPFKAQLKRIIDRWLKLPNSEQPS
jgi:hypothetical protein